MSKLKSPFTERLELGHLEIIAATDRRRTISSLLAKLSRGEREHVDRLPTARQRRHFALGRLAAHEAVRRVLDDGFARARIEILNGRRREPIVQVNDQPGDVSVSIAHAGWLGVACAWRNPNNGRYSAGVDVEKIRPNQVIESSYAFSRRERKMLMGISDARIAGLAAWTVKEAVWKALGANDRIGPEAIHIQSLDLSLGCAQVSVRYQLAKLLRGRQIRIDSRILKLRDDAYVLSIAQVDDRESACIVAGSTKDEYVHNR